MIKYIRFNNFYSYFDETEVSFELNKQATHSAYDFMVETTQDKIRLNKIMAVLGANGSGKTQILRAFGFLAWLIGEALIDQSYDEIKFDSFILTGDENTNFEIGFIIQESNNAFQEFRYEVSLTQKVIIREALYKKTSTNFSYIFEIIKTKDLIEYKRKGFLKPSLALNKPENLSLLIYASILEDELAIKITNYFSKFTRNFTRKGKNLPITSQIISFTEIFNEYDTLKKQAEKLLRQFDTGIDTISIEKTQIFLEDGTFKEALIPFALHKMDKKSFSLSLLQESNGTQSAYALLGYLLTTLMQGGIAIIDELDNDLHPHLLPEIFNLFRSEHTNPHNAQLIFTCHTPEVFNILNKHQIYLVEKINQQSEAWRLDEVEGVRNDDNLYAKYMAGAFSAVPNL